MPFKILERPKEYEGEKFDGYVRWVRADRRGEWEAKGYVLTKYGEKRGPDDLVFMVHKSRLQK